MEQWRSSKMQHPRLHMSEAWSYCFSIRDSSGALYHLELTWLDKERGLSFYCCKVWPSFLITIFFIWRSLSSLLIPCLRMEFLIRLELPEPFPRQLSGNVREMPKSQILIWQSLLIKILAGFKSLCMTLAEWQNFIEHKRLYIINLMWSYEILVKTPYLMTFLRSESSNSMTKNMFWRV